jgi:ABC-2 type transport system permease protein
MMSKIWSMGLVVLLASGLYLIFIIEGVPGVPITGLRSLFLCGTALHIIAAILLGIFLATFARTMPQFLALADRRALFGVALMRFRKTIGSMA